MEQKAWTFSHLQDYETCPRKFYEIRIARSVIDPPNEHSIWGDRVHKALELRIKDGTPLPEGMTRWEGLMAKLAALPGEKHPEMKMALDDAFQPTEWSSAWTRGIGDLVVIDKQSAMVLDYKTGKRKLTHQLSLYAAYVLAHYPSVEYVQTGFVWLAENKIDKEVVRREDLPNVWNRFLPTYKRLANSYSTEVWPPKPNGLCAKYCPVKSCQFNGRK